MIVLPNDSNADKKNDKNNALEWKGIGFDVKDKVILEGIGGSVQAKSLCAIMGPSGAGKSSLLNILSGRLSSGDGKTIKGDVFVYGQKIDPVKERRRIAYVMQEDALFQTQTPREAFEFSAALRLGKGVSKEKRSSLVQKLLSDLGLESCADTMIGSVMIPGISGGEKKRTAIGVELISNPDLLFLDEPTSGLDSYAAFRVVQILKELSSKGKTVVCTIHQPSSEVFDIFDSTYLLAKGRVVYNGSVDKMTSHFKTLGYPCPQHYNPADFVMFLMQEKQQDVKKIADSWSAIETNDANNNIEIKVEDDGKTENLVVADEVEKKIPVGFFTEMYYLARREARQVGRNKIALVAQFGTTLFINLLLGSIFYGAADFSDIKNDMVSVDAKVRTSFGAITFVAVGAMFGLAQPVLLSFPIERPIFLREYASGVYGAVAYFLSKVMVEIPMAVITSTLIYLSTYWLCGFDGNFAFLVFFTAMLGLVASSTSLLIGSVSPNVQTALQLTPLLLVPQLLFSGFYVPIDQIPEWLRWAQYLCSLKYSLNLLMISVFDDIPSTWNSSVPESLFNIAVYGCEGKVCDENALINPYAVMPSNDVYKDDMWVYVGILAAVFFGFRLLALHSLASRAKQ